VEKNPTWILVVAGLIRDRAGRLLLQQALPGKPHSGSWEFPGGKVEGEENPRVALARELVEELGLELKPADLAPLVFADQPGEEARPAIVLILYDCRAWEGEPRAREGQVWGWFTADEARTLPLGAMDRTLLDGLPG
jgi:8-oxo-dGTP diphosphatase